MKLFILCGGNTLCPIRRADYYRSLRLCCACDDRGMQDVFEKKNAHIGVLRL